MFTGPLLERMGMTDYFDVIVSGDTTANKKPHPEPILHACAIFGVPPDRNLHIGDSENDMLAARAAGSRLLPCPTATTRKGRWTVPNCDALVSDLLDAAHRVALHQQDKPPTS
jgi:phosphoglycolate phosphatase